MVSFELGDETDRNTADRLPDRYTGVHQCHRAGANARHRGRSVRFHDFAADSNRVRKFAFGRDNRFDRTFGKRAVTDLTPARTAEPSGLPDAEWRKIVVEDKPFRLFAPGVPIDHLRFFCRSQGRKRNGLRLTSGKKSRSM